MLNLWSYLVSLKPLSSEVCSFLSSSADFAKWHYPSVCFSLFLSKAVISQDHPLWSHKHHKPFLSFFLPVFPLTRFQTCSQVLPRTMLPSPPAVFVCVWGFPASSAIHPPPSLHAQHTPKLLRALVLTAVFIPHFLVNWSL